MRYTADMKIVKLDQLPPFLRGCVERHTRTRQRREERWKDVDWNHSDIAIGKDLGVSRQAVNKRRRKLFKKDVDATKVA